MPVSRAKLIKSCTIRKYPGNPIAGRDERWRVMGRRREGLNSGPGGNPFNDRYRRHVFEQVVRLPNVVGRRLTP